MTDEYHKLPGGCCVKQLPYNQQQITLKPELLQHYFSPDSQYIDDNSWDQTSDDQIYANQNPALNQNQNKNLTLLITQGHILITDDPIKQNLMHGIQELQLRQDELKQDFEPTILALLRVLTTGVGFKSSENNSCRCSESNDFRCGKGNNCNGPGLKL